MQRPVHHIVLLKVHLSINVKNKEVIQVSSVALSGNVLPRLLSKTMQRDWRKSFSHAGKCVMTNMIGWETHKIFEKASWQNFDFVNGKFRYGDC